MLPELCPPLRPSEVVKRWFRRLQLMIGVRKPKHSGMITGFGFKCLSCVNHQVRFDSLDEALEYAIQHNTLYHDGRGN